MPTLPDAADGPAIGVRDDVPHQFPFRLVERAEALGENRCAIVLGTADGFLTYERAWPVTLVAEALAQAILLVFAPSGGSPLRLVSLDRVELCRPFGAGDRLEVVVSELATFGALHRYLCRALRGGALAAVAEVTVSG